MITVQFALGAGAGLLGVAGYGPYILDTFRGKTKPDKIAWLIWLLEYSVLFGAQFTAGARSSLWLIGLQLLGVSIICGLSMRYGVGSFDRNKLLLLGSVIVAMTLWKFMDSASDAILLLLAVEMSGVVLTIRKVLRDPESETLTMWLLAGMAGILTLPTIGHTSFILYLYPASLSLMSFGVITAARIGRRQISVTSSTTEAV